MKKQKKNGVLIVVTVLVFIGMIAVVFWNMNRGQIEKTAEKKTEEKQEAKEFVEISRGEALEIATDKITENVSFYPILVDGVQMEVLAVRDAEGTIRTAFNTCQVCYGSGQGYYKQEGQDLVCQNCGNHFTIDQVEVESGGCNPWPIFEDDKTVTDEKIEISYDFLTEAKEVFSNWKTEL